MTKKKEGNLIDAFGKIAKNALNKVEKLEEAVQKEVGKVSDKLDKKLDSLGDKLEQGGNRFINALEDNLNKEVDKLPKPFQKPVKDFLSPVIDGIGKTAKDLIGGQKNNVKEFAQRVYKEASNVMKSIFSNISAVISGEKKPEKALTDVTKTCEKAGGAIMKAANQAKKSFVEMVGGKMEKVESFVEKVTKETGKGHSQGR